MKRKKLTALLLSAAILIGAQSGMFAAEATGNINADTKALLATLGIMQGDDNGNFNDDAALTREQFVKIVVKIADKDFIPAGGTAPFFDVSYTRWSAPFIDRGVALGYFNGFPDGSFQPEAEVLPEQVCNVVLKMLGADSSEATGNWAQSKVAAAGHMGLLEDVTYVIGQPISRIDTAKIIKNALFTQMKDSKSYLIEKMECTFIEDAVLISDKNTQSGYVTTSAGVFKKAGAVSQEDMRLRGDLVVGKANEIVAFFPAVQTCETYSLKETYPDKMVLSDNEQSRQDFFVNSDTVIYIGGNAVTFGRGFSSVPKGADIHLYYDEYGVLEYIFAEESAASNERAFMVKSVLSDGITAFGHSGDEYVKIENDTVVYEGALAATFGQTAGTLSLGDKLTFHENESGILKYITLERNAIAGPGYIGEFAVNADTRYTRDGLNVEKGDVLSTDICYYADTANVLLAYSKSITGVYENAFPTKDNISRIQVSGKTYDVTEKGAKSKLSSDGDIAYGDTVTLRFGKDGGVADVVTPEESGAVAGVLISCAPSVRIDAGGNTVSEYRAQVMTLSGETHEYAAEKDYTSQNGNPVSVSFSNGKAVLAVLNQKNEIEGAFQWQLKKLGKFNLSSDLNIIDTAVKTEYSKAKVKKIYPQRIDGAVLKTSDILFAEVDNGTVTGLILNGYTGDLLQYGIVLKAQGISVGTYAAGSYKVNIGGLETELGSNQRKFSVSTGQSVSIDTDEKNGVLSIKALNTLNETVESVDDVFVHTKSGAYRLADNAVIYREIANTELSEGTRYEVISKDNLDFAKKVTAYYDKTETDGGRIRVIVVRK